MFSSVQCMSDGIRLVSKDKTMDRMFAQGKSDDPSCSQIFESRKQRDSTAPFLHIPLGRCGMKLEANVSELDYFNLYTDYPKSTFSEYLSDYCYSPETPGVHHPTSVRLQDSMLLPDNETNTSH